MIRSKHDLPDKIWNHLSAVRKNAELQTGFPSKTLSVRKSRTKHDLSVKTWNHLSVVSKDVKIKT